MEATEGDAFPPPYSPRQSWERPAAKGLASGSRRLFGGTEDLEAAASARKSKRGVLKGYAKVLLICACFFWAAHKLLRLAGPARHQGEPWSRWKDSRAVRGHTRHFLASLEEQTEPEGSSYGGGLSAMLTFGGQKPWGASKKRFPKSKVDSTYLKVPSAESARNASNSFTARAHIAGTEGDRLSALRVKAQWEELLGLGKISPEANVYDAGTPQSRKALTGFSKPPKKGARSGWKAVRLVKRMLRRRGLLKATRHGPKPRVWIDSYYPLLNLPLNHSLTLSRPGESTPYWTAKLTEDEVKGDTTSKAGPDQVPTFHGLSFSGTATGKLVYARKGRKQDFLDLQAQGIDFTGKIAIVQYSGNFRGLKVKAAEEAGAVACIIFTDPAEDGEVTTQNGHLAYPDGPARQPSSVQRGSVQALSIYPGDPLTPFEPAYKNTSSRLPRDDPSINIPRIPSIPISFEDAVPLLQSLNGKGIEFGTSEGGLGYLGVGYWTGPGEDDVRLENYMDDKITKIWNTMAVIPGHLDEAIIIGNHNDAWTYGAGDPNSGTAVVHEIVKGLGVLLSQGWRPLRTIILASWDAEEAGLIGSTEFGEDFSSYLKENVIAYLNTDVGAAGTYFSVSASPSLADLFELATSKVADPDDITRTLNEKLHADADEAGEIGRKNPDNPPIGPLGSGSDYTVFLAHLGIASSDIGYGRKGTDPVYHYHSIYDSAYWMNTFGDPTFKRHEAVAKVLGLAALHLVSEPIAPINVTAYAFELSSYANRLQRLADSSASSLELSTLFAAIQKVQGAALALAKEASIVSSELEHAASGVGARPSKTQLRRLEASFVKVKSINRRLKSFEANLIDEGGLDGRTWYRNLVVAPGRFLGYGATTLPGVTESLTLDHNAEKAQHEVARLAARLQEVALGLAAEPKKVKGCRHHN